MLSADNELRVIDDVQREDEDAKATEEEVGDLPVEKHGEEPEPEERQKAGVDVAAPPREVHTSLVVRGERGERGERGGK